MCWTIFSQKFINSLLHIELVYWWLFFTQIVLLSLRCSKTWNDRVFLQFQTNQTKKNQYILFHTPYPPYSPTLILGIFRPGLHFKKVWPNWFLSDWPSLVTTAWVSAWFENQNFIVNDRKQQTDIQTTKQTKLFFRHKNNKKNFKFQKTERSTFSGNLKSKWRDRRIRPYNS